MTLIGRFSKSSTRAAVPGLVAPARLATLDSEVRRLATQQPDSEEAAFRRMEVELLEVRINYL